MDICGDTARIIDDLLERAEWKGGVYNIPGKRRVSNLELVKLLSVVMDKEVKIKFVSDSPGHDRRYCMSTRLSYQVTPLKEGLRKTYEWYVNNEWWRRLLIDDKFFKENEPWRQ